MHPNVHSSPVYNSRDMEISQMSINRRMDKKMWYIYTIEYYSAIMPSAAPWMDLQIIILSQTERQIPYDITYMLDLKYDTNKLTYKTETDSQTWKTNLWLPKRKGGRDTLGV